MPKLTVLPHPQLCPQGAQIEAREGVSICDTLLEHAERLLKMADLAEQEVRGGTMSGVLRLGSLESAAGARLPPMLSAFHAQFPEISIELQTGTTDALLQRLRRYELDAAFVSQPFEIGGLSSVRAFDEELVLITAKGTPPILQPSQLSGQTVVAFPHGCSYRRRLSEWLSEVGALQGRFLDLGSYHAIVACVAAGAGVAIMPAEVLDHAVLGATVQRHPLPDRFRHSQTHLAWLGKISAPLSALLELLNEASKTAFDPTTSPIPSGKITASATERAAIIATRSDLVAEGGAFYAPTT